MGTCITSAWRITLNELLHNVNECRLLQVNKCNNDSKPLNVTECSISLAPAMNKGFLRSERLNSWHTSCHVVNSSKKPGQLHSLIQQSNFEAFCRHLK